ncbi:hypothetical protein CLAFUW4_20113 [Fulvia fulva]|uniref:uncharacterized protein n=1 Tax=Passalora fulva TaxID=5499 RepID=UPI002852B8A9|nr:uncharacterized protein CLAFUR5_20113 [Fulvia fulva]KAK4609307.1 hypothetical protein CLAFUR4_20113 [Fulvia fulva]KAK4609521.1 hypothetical protein CLAFUR0_20113 [Fulvia fulva]WMI39098.1 hypothetical protein CLAFUR5_20113 [Fulvia fulva]WPV22648.1 hypothetical protein CLAFUW4_20113 [Fulvia fulva]WPV37683.1 hypothetical protein CLAFUW7_20113 [Fulvia fulva]
MALTRRFLMMLAASTVSAQSQTDMRSDRTLDSTTNIFDVSMPCSLVEGAAILDVVEGVSCAFADSHVPGEIFNAILLSAHCAIRPSTTGSRGSLLSNREVFGLNMIVNTVMP